MVMQIIYHILPFPPFPSLPCSVFVFVVVVPGIFVSVGLFHVGG